MKKWMQHEIFAGEYFATLVPGCLKYHGGHNSYKGDYEIIGTNQYVEVKSPASQGGQIVLMPDEDGKVFKVSPRSVYRPGVNGQKLVDFASTRFNEIMDLEGGEGYGLNVDESLLLSTLLESCVSKNTAFIVSVGDDGLPLVFSRSRLSDYIQIKAVVRRKKSGSRPINKRDIPAAVEMFRLMGQKIEICPRGKITGSSKIDRFSVTFGKNTVVFSGLGTDEASARIYSKTRNLNLMLVLHISGTQDPEELEKFIQSVKTGG